MSDETPPAGDGDDRRKFERAPLSLLVQYRFNTFEDFLAEYSINISAGGIFIRTQDPREEGAMIYLQFYLKDGAKLIEGLGKVVRVNAPAKYGADAGMGVEFVNFDEESVALINEIIAAKSNRPKN
ncbi:MAG: TIGR02266 family protein [Myxococcaceae bacterium]